jgi:hypothetical protein
MPVQRILLAQDSEDNQILRTDNRRRFVINTCPEWQMLFGPNSLITNSSHVVKIAAEFNKDDLNSVRFIGYLYDPIMGSTAAASGCTFSVYRVVNPNWSDNLVYTVSGTVLSNGYWYADVPVGSLSPADLEGGETLAIEATLTRLSDVMRDKVYINHLGIYDSIIRLRQDVDFLDITKADE